MKTVIEALARRDAVSDEALDALFPPELTRVSAQHFTPVEVARRASEWLAPDPSSRVLDVGAGAGRFCLVGALHTGGEFTGIEQRASLVSVAREVAREHSVARVTFVQGDIRDVDYGAFDGFYVFNPFAENYLPPDERIDDSVEWSQARFDADIAFLEARLAERPPGTRVVTWNGFGGHLEQYVCARREGYLGAVLEYLVRIG
jgi:SAM-dependent methyltransferase